MQTNLLQVNTFRKFEILLHNRHACSDLVMAEAITTLAFQPQQNISQSHKNECKKYGNAGNMHTRSI